MLVAPRHPVTRLKLTTAVLAIVAAAAADVALADLKAEAPKNVDLTAIWKINPKLSDDPQQVLAKRRDEENNPGGVPSAGRGGRGTTASGSYGDIFGGVLSGTIGKGGIHTGTGGGTDADRPEADPAPSSTMRMPLDSFLATAEQFEIEQRPDAMTIRTVDETTSCKPGETDKVRMPNGDMVERHCGWQRGAFVIELVSDDGEKRTNRYELRHGEKQLVMTSEITGGHGKLRGLQLKRVYDRALSF
ncbi:MAG TPA: hypothetical protein VFS52_21715 [Steroidobacteraceae bacterium]|nr:hypothetical protein [Steroidobacteraceae bacterium]